MQPSWRAPKSLLERLSPLQFRVMVAGACLAIALWDFYTELPTGFLYMVVVGLTFWSSDRWMPMAVGVASAPLILIGLASPLGATSFRLALLIRMGGAAIFVASGWLITRHRALLSESLEQEAVLRTIFESEPACVKIVGVGGVLQDMNRAGLEMIEAGNLESVRGAPLLPLVAEPHRDAFARMCERVFAGESVGLQFELVGLKGTRRWLHSQNAPLRDAAGRVTALLAVTQDITDQKRAEALLRDSEHRLTQAAEIAGLGFVEHDHRTDVVYLSVGARRIFGIGPTEPWSYERASAITHPDDRELADKSVAQALDPSGSGVMVLDFRIVRPDGTTVFISTRSQTHFADLGQGSAPLKTVGTLLDVTDQKRAKAQRDALALRVLEAQENERRAVARDLHDEIGQALSALKLNLLRLRREGGGAGPIVADSLRIADEVLQQVRDIALSLRPSILDDLGLGAAVQWYAEQTAGRANLALSCEVDGNVGGLSPATEIACFRVLQEALTNVVRHAAATSVLVQLRYTEHHLELVVRDDGCGFDVDDVITHAGRGASMGLLGIKERAALLGGVTTVTSAPSVGCEVRVHLPRVAHDRALAEAIA